MAKELKEHKFVPMFKYQSKSGKGVIITTDLHRVYCLPETYDSIVIGQFCSLLGKWFKDDYRGFCFTEKASV